LKILDLGAGNGWLANRLAQRGHLVAAIDLMTNSFDSLGAYIHYEAPFIPIQADFDHLPFTDGSDASIGDASTGFDLIIFNASFHYSTCYEKTLQETLRVLRPQGLVVLLDSPLYRDPASGEQMVREREACFTRQYGFPSNALSSQNYLTYERLESLAVQFSLDWRRYRPRYGLRWALRPWKARLLGQARHLPALCDKAGSVLLT
jgi:SAM-dependent methyltransferase